MAYRSLQTLSIKGIFRYIYLVRPRRRSQLHCHQRTYRISLVYDAGDGSAVWSVGNSAFCKVKLSEPGITPEAAIAFVDRLVCEKKPGFEVPKLLYQTEYKDRYCLFLSRVQGRTLGDAWPSLDEKWRHHYANAVVDVCKFLASQECEEFRGVDGKNALEPFLVKSGAEEEYSPDNLRQFVYKWVWPAQNLCSTMPTSVLATS